MDITPMMFNITIKTQKGMQVSCAIICTSGAPLATTHDVAAPPLTDSRRTTAAMRLSAEEK